ncbi:MAG TPA: DNA repair protein RadA [Acidobacteriota bacterium]|nr:DNA repair protein RadA [Acidobacteriota bacterium]
MIRGEQKLKTAYFCSRCGAAHPKWQGQCRECGAWNSLIEERVAARKKTNAASSSAEAVRMTDITDPLVRGYQSGIAEFDRVLGGQLLPGMTVLVAGDPGIGKSTLLLQVAEAYSRQGTPVLYVTGEESLPQIKSRARRLAVTGENIDVVNDTSLEAILAVAEKGRFGVVLVDSIQTVSCAQFASPPGTVAQVREAAGALIAMAKASGKSLFLVGHVTKDGIIAGPKVLEHMVDTVISFEGDSSHLYRVLRATKNRFGSVLEIGLFEMTSSGLAEVANPSSLFLGERAASGAVVAGICEGTRPLLVEVQALVTSSSYGTPQRVAGGIDGKKLSLLLAILEKRCGYPMAANDVFVSLAGGLKVFETALDLPVVTAIVSSLKNRPVDPKTVVIGEIGLSGEVRGVAAIDQRAAEAAKLGFTTVVLPQANLAQVVGTSIKLAGVKDLQSALDIVLG